MTVCVLVAESDTVKSTVFVPVSPSVTVTSLMVMSGLNPVLQSFAGELLLRGFGAEVTKSAALSLVSTQPPDFLKSAVVLLGAGAGPVPSKPFAVLP